MNVFYFILYRIYKKYKIFSSAFSVEVTHSTIGAALSLVCVENFVAAAIAPAIPIVIGKALLRVSHSKASRKSDLMFRFRFLKPTELLMGDQNCFIRIFKM